jgi:O-acetyl-ADP-ribose deacetylase (regulator of RNase III)
MKTIKGDLIELAKQGCFDIIVHGCNCFSNMGGGIACQIGKEFPSAKNVDYHSTVGDYTKLGNYSSAVINSYETNFLVVNAYTQYEPGPDARLNAIEMVFDKLNHEFAGNTVGVPLIGCGIGGLSWWRVKRVIKKAAPDLNLIAVKYDDKQSKRPRTK